MSADRRLGRVVASLETVSVDGRYYRFISRRRTSTALDGSRRGGRWGPPDAFRVLYLNDTYDGCVIEAYRHTTDASMDPVKPPVNLGLVACDVAGTNILDLRSATARFDLGLDLAILYSEPQPPTGSAYQACSRIAQAAHQLGRHGLLAPSATQRGLTLALFTDLLPDEERPTGVGGTITWEQLPADPRQLRVIRTEGD